MEELKVKNVVIGKQFETCENYEKFSKIVREKKIKVMVVETRQKINIEKNLSFHVLWPNAKDKISDNVLNNNSLVCKLVYKNFSMLFTGDIEVIAETEILKTYQSQPNIFLVTILKVGHHRLKNFFYRRIFKGNPTKNCFDWRRRE